MFYYDLQTEIASAAITLLTQGRKYVRILASDSRNWTIEITANHRRSHCPYIINQRGAEFMRRNAFLSVLSFIVFVLAATAQASEMGEVAIFADAVSWTDVGTAKAAAQKIQSDLKLTRDIQILSDDAIGAFAEQNTDDGNLDIIITFGYFPVSLYAPGNAERDDSVGELFLEGGNMFINTADYIFYVTQGGGANGDSGLKNMTDSNFDMWGDDASTDATEDGEKYTPSLVDVTFVANRPFKMSQVEADSDWELEAAFGTLGDKADPAIIHNLTYDGRVGIAFQAGGTLPRAEVIIEMIDNFLVEKVKAQTVEPGDKLSCTWGEIKGGS
jgi:hypothetical protein